MNITAIEIIQLSGSEKCIIKVSEKRNKKLCGYITIDGRTTYEEFVPCRVFQNRKLNRLITFTNRQLATEMARECLGKSL